MTESSSKCQRSEERTFISDTNWSDLYTLLVCPLEGDIDRLCEFVENAFKSSSMLPQQSGIALKKMIVSIRGTYNENKYHNFTHASHALLNCAKILSDIVSQNPLLPKAEGLALLFAATIHDIGHEGVTNATLVKENHSLAIMYSDQSVAEMNSLACGFQLLFDRADHDILEGFTPEERKTFRTTVIDIVLSTNIMDKERQQDFQRKFDTAKKTSEDGKFDMNCPKNRLLIYNIILRAADVGASMQNAETSRTWSHRFYLEQKEAQDAGRGPEVIDNEFPLQHEKFMEFHAKLLAETLTSTGSLTDCLTRDLLDNTNRNVALWRVEGKDVVTEWGKAYQLQLLKAKI
mmetsp:Transcript_34815/g.33129  ORF Transcript_34815/g.33129 Transcript_34815/m.33129 type:complete len:347 (+) Transcript_34815:167-1207(+)